MHPLLAALRRLAYRIWHRRVRASLQGTDSCSLMDFELLVSPGVLHPAHFLSSRLLALHLTTLDLGNRTVADVGTGSGLLALVAARLGASVWATDINPASVDCARENAERNGLADRVNVVNSDVLEGLPPGLRLDFVVSNPPFYPRDALNLRDRAFAAGAGYGFFERLAAALGARLAPGGSLIMVHSSDADFEPVREILQTHRIIGRVVSTRRGLFETLTIREFQLELQSYPPASGAFDRSERAG
ncbi:MAG: class I SAM-dependent methyltransferase [Vicinamibacteria bacterium]|nr:class I SAM-dependent methyltransferase [Vicinamibacteria bacterium]